MTKKEAVHVKLLGLDFETYSDVDLKKHGLARYVSSPNFRVLLAAVAYLDEDDAVGVGILDFVENYDEAKAMLADLLDNTHIAAHNAGFEIAVLQQLGIGPTPTRFVDSAAIARTAGAGSSLEAAAPQMLGVDKMASGKDGIMLFCIPGTYQMSNGNDAFDPQVTIDHPKEWVEFQKYCALDAALSLRLSIGLDFALSPEELHFSVCTMWMNATGWHVDLPLVEEMNRRYLANLEQEQEKFRAEVPAAAELNLNSFPQLSKWCMDRGIRAASFDEQHVAQMITSIEARLPILKYDDELKKGYGEVLKLLRIKQSLGGSSLKKLRTILDTTSEDSILYDQYEHAGAGISLRTTGRSVQMQNLKRLGGKGDDVSELSDPTVHWDNAKLARNLRQVFTSREPDGKLVVGDYSAVESRGLAWLAGEDWKLDTYRQGLGVYEMQAAKFYGINIEDVVPHQRQFAKVGELSCGYEAGAVAVQEFAEKMGVDLSLGEAKKLVGDWRIANPKTVLFWQALQDALWEVDELGLSTVVIPEGEIQFETALPPPSLQELTEKKLKTLVVSLKVPCSDDLFQMHRIFHGFTPTANGFRYWKPSKRKTGDLWTPTYIDPKSGHRKYHSLYGGKLAGILTQSLCREIFMRGLSQMTIWTHSTDNTLVVGQFHDEIVLDWVPPKALLDPDLDAVTTALSKVMSTTELPEFPLACEVKSDYRYIK